MNETSKQEIKAGCFASFLNPSYKLFPSQYGQYFVSAGPIQTFLTKNDYSTTNKCANICAKINGGKTREDPGYFDQGHPITYREMIRRSVYYTVKTFKPVSVEHCLYALFRIYMSVWHLNPQVAETVWSYGLDMMSDGVGVRLDKECQGWKLVTTEEWKPEPAMDCGQTLDDIFKELYK